MRLAATGCGALIISMSTRAPKGWRWDTISDRSGGGGPDAGRTGANCFRPKAVKIAAMLVS